MEARQEVEAAKGKTQELRMKMEELEEEVSLQRSPDASLLSEMDRSLGSMNWDQDKEQVKLTVFKKTPQPGLAQGPDSDN